MIVSSCSSGTRVDGDDARGMPGVASHRIRFRAVVAWVLNDFDPGSIYRYVQEAAYDFQTSALLIHSTRDCERICILCKFLRSDYHLSTITLV